MLYEIRNENIKKKYAGKTTTTCPIIPHTQFYTTESDFTSSWKQTLIGEMVDAFQSRFQSANII